MVVGVVVLFSRSSRGSSSGSGRGGSSSVVVVVAAAELVNVDSSTGSGSYGGGRSGKVTDYRARSSN